MMDPEMAMRQAWMTANDYALHTLDSLLDRLSIDQTQPGWQAQLALFAQVWAAMIAAAAQDFETAMSGGIISKGD